MNVTQIASFFPSYSWDVLLIRALLALVWIVFGVLVGKSVAFILKRISDKMDLNKLIQPSFIKLLIVVIKWAIYIAFISIALRYIEFFGLTHLLGSVLVVVPAFIASLFIISIGLAIATYLRAVIEEAEVTNWKTISLYLYYFIVYVSGVYALKVALLSLDSIVTISVLISFSVVYIVAIIYYYFNDHTHKN